MYHHLTTFVFSDVLISSNELSTQFTQDKAGVVGASQLLEVTSLFLLPRRLFTSKQRRMPKKIRLCTVCSTQTSGYKFCKSCKENRTKEYQKVYRTNYERKDTEEQKERCRQYYIKNKEVLNKRCRNYYNSINSIAKAFYKRDATYNSEKYHTKVIDNFINRSKSITTSLKDRIEKDPNYKIYIRTIQFLTSSIFNNSSKNKVKEVIGCAVEEYKIYLESKFKDGMNWDNRGIVGWHIDHIIPCASFDLSNETEFKKAFHFTNTQPMWSVDNVVKSNKVE